MMCLDCGHKIASGAIACRCGWKVPPRLQPLPHRAPDLRPGPRPGRASNQHVEAIREAYAKSHACRTKMGIGQAAREVLNEMREPGEDREESNAAGYEHERIPMAADNQSRPPTSAEPALGIPWDALEVEMQNGGKP